MDDFLRLYVVLLSVACSIVSIVYARRTEKYKRFAIIAAVVPLEWVLFYALKVTGILQPINLNMFSLLITSQTLTFLLGYLLYAMAAVG